MCIELYVHNHVFACIQLKVAVQFGPVIALFDQQGFICELIVRIVRRLSALKLYVNYCKLLRFVFYAVRGVTIPSMVARHFDLRRSNFKFKQNHK